jgi:hypothetical protein
MGEYLLRAARNSELAGEVTSARRERFVEAGTPRLWRLCAELRPRGVFHSGGVLDLPRPSERNGEVVCLKGFGLVAGTDAATRHGNHRSPYSNVRALDW